MKDKKLRRGLQSTEKKFEAAAYNAATAEMLLPESEGFLEAEGMERTFKFTQDQLKVCRKGRARGNLNPEKCLDRRDDEATGAERLDAGISGVVLKEGLPTK